MAPSCWCLTPLPKPWRRRVCAPRKSEPQDLHCVGGQASPQRATLTRYGGDDSSLKTWPARGGLLVIAAYKVIASPVFYALGARCRHEPTCSSYAADAIRAQGLWRGSWLALGRILRCRPGGSWGVDLAPLERNSAPWWQVWAFRTPYRGHEGIS
ncbi:membrane protein insertion efficiency factor YidD [Hyphomonadaceae bacterium BL14]|nr:membrane protein insertion efficiency factor YidD [Hyphomonadaceae bacterium BL14]